MQSNHTLRTWLYGIESEILYRLLEWIVRRRGISFVRFMTDLIEDGGSQNE